MNSKLFTPPFLHNGSEMSDLMHRYDWSASVLGDPSTWPQSLRSNITTMMSSAFPMFLFWGSEPICLYNDAFRPSFGENGRHPAIGKNAQEVWLESWHFIGPLVKDVIKTGKSLLFEDQPIPFYHNGKVRDIHWTFNLSPVANDFGEVCGVLAIFNETTEKVLLLKKLEESNRLYSFAIDASELGTWDLNTKTKHFLANDRLKDWFGIDSTEQVDLSVALNAIAEKDRKRVSDAIEYAMKSQSGGHYDIEYTIVNAKTGQERVVKAKGRAAFDEAGQAYRFNGTLQDITAEVATRETNQKLSILVENSVDLMAILGMDGKNSYINKAGKDLLGIDETADVTQIPISDLHTAEQLAYVESEILPSVMTGGKWAGTFAVKNMKTGEIIPLRNNCHRIDDERTGEPIGVGTVMRDIRSEVNTRQKLEDEVRERTRELIKLNEQLERKNKDLSSFAFVSSHDLQEPLRKINTFISRIEESIPPLSDKNLGYFEKIKKSSTRMQILINDLLSFSRIGINRVNLEQTDLNSILAETLEEYRSQIEAVNGIVTLAKLPVLNAIPFQIRQLFNNLIGNAIKFVRPGIPLSITITCDLIQDNREEYLTTGNTYHRITIQDNGIGFQQAYQEKIFEVFQRLHSRDAYEGTGIGLSICKKIMENHHGHISANGIPGQGAAFELLFPA